MDTYKDIFSYMYIDTLYGINKPSNKAKLSSDFA